MFTVLKYQPKINEAYIYLFMRLDNQFICWETGTEEVFFKKAEIKPLTYPVLSRSTLVVDLVTLSNPVVLCFLSEKPLSPLVSYLRSIDLVWRTTWDITILYTVLYLIFRNFTKKKFKEKKIKVKIILNTQIPYSY